MDNDSRERGSGVIQRCFALGEPFGPISGLILKGNDLT